MCVLSGLFVVSCRAEKRTAEAKAALERAAAESESQNVYRLLPE
jgi:hypothetical protein